MLSLARTERSQPDTAVLTLPSLPAVLPCDHHFLMQCGNYAAEINQGSSEVTLYLRPRRNGEVYEAKWVIEHAKPLAAAFHWIHSHNVMPGSCRVRTL